MNAKENLNQPFQSDCQSCRRLCDFMEKLAWIICFAIIPILLLAGVLEGVLRLKGVQPVPLAARGLSATVPDGWTQWAMRPNVTEGPEYVKTNTYGLHEDREFELNKTEGVLRVAIVGSSVIWAPGHDFKNTIPRAAEERMKEKGCQVEVMNFGNQGFNLVNISSLMQVRVHQFKPDVVVLMTDFQVAYPQWPGLVPQSGEPTAVKQLSWYEGLLMRASEKSALLSLLNNPANIRQILEKRLGFPIEQPALPAKPQSKTEKAIQANGAGKASKTGEGNKNPAKHDKPQRAMPLQNQSVEDYERRRAKELGAVVTAMSSFYSELQIPLYFVTPYGPFYKSTDQELNGFSLNMLTEAAQVYGSLREALSKQAAFITRTILEKAKNNHAQVINMDDLSRNSDGLKNQDFSSDGIHFTAEGNRHVGQIIADRLINDNYCWNQ